MSNELQTADKPTTALAMPDIAALQNAAGMDEEFKGISGSRVAFLPRLQLFTSNSGPCKQGKIGVAHYGVIIGKDDPIDIGKDVICLPIAWRPKAMYVKGEDVLAYHKPQSEEFQRIKAAGEKDSNSGNLYGPEFLLWIAKYGYVTLYFCSKTARNEAPALRALLPVTGGVLQPTLLTAQFIETTSYSWHGPKVTASAQSIDYPPAETLQPTLVDFLNPKDSEVEQIKPEEANAQNTDR